MGVKALVKKVCPRYCIGNDQTLYGEEAMDETKTRNVKKKKARPLLFHIPAYITVCPHILDLILHRMSSLLSHTHRTLISSRNDLSSAVPSTGLDRFRLPASHGCRVCKEGLQLAEIVLGQLRRIGEACRFDKLRSVDGDEVLLWAGTGQGGVEKVCLDGTFVRVDGTMLHIVWTALAWELGDQFVTGHMGLRKGSLEGLYLLVAWAAGFVHCLGSLCTL
jgi:hypothetical protein